MSPRLIYILLSVLCLGTTPVAAQQIYKWTDSSGRTHYGDRPSNGNATEVPIAPAPSVDANQAQRDVKRNRLLRAYEKERADQRAEAKKVAAQKAKLARDCERLRKKIAHARDAQYIFRKTEEGTKKVYSHEEREQYEKRLRDIEQEHCQ